MDAGILIKSASMVIIIDHGLLRLREGGRFM
jgi:hypothetical protein